MALNAAQQWWIRSDGVDTNGGGYDSTISGAGTNYSDQAVAQLTLSDVVTTGTTAVTSVTGGFTTAMIGNIIRITGDDYYAIISRTNTNTIGVDRNTGTGTGQTSHIGGAWLSLANISNGGTAPAPAMASPLAAGHTVNIRGSGSDNPGSADYTQTGYYTAAATGSVAVGFISIVGYNGRARFDVDNLLMYLSNGWAWQGLLLFATANNYDRFIDGGTSGLPPHDRFYNMVFDVNGFDTGVVATASEFINCTVKNSGSASAGTQTMWWNAEEPSYSITVIGCYFRNYRGYILTKGLGVFANNIFSNGAATGHAQLTVILDNQTGEYRCRIINNTFDGGASDGVSIAGSAINVTMVNNIFSNNGGYGVNCASTAAINAAQSFIDYNDYFSNTSGARNGLNAGAHDLTLDPQYVNSSGGNFAIGTNLKAKGSPSIVGATSGTTASYVDIGAAQRQEAGGGGGTTGFASA